MTTIGPELVVVICSRKSISLGEQFGVIVWSQADIGTVQPSPTPTGIEETDPYPDSVRVARTDEAKNRMVPNTNGNANFVLISRLLQSSNSNWHTL